MKKLYLSKLIFLMLLIFSVSLNLFSNISTPDSLLQKFSAANTDSLKIVALYKIVDFWKVNDNDSIIFYSKKLIKISRQATAISKSYKGYYWLISRLSNTSFSDSALYYGFEGLNIFSKDSLFYPQTVMLIFIAEEYRSQNQIEKALLYINKARMLAKKTDKLHIQIGIFNRMAAIYFELKKPEDAIIWADSSMSIADLIKSTDYKLNNLTIKGAANRDMGNYQKALSLFKHALIFSKEINDEVGTCSLYNNISTTYLYLNEYQKAVEYSLASYNISSLNEWDALTVVSSEMLASAYAYIGDFEQAYFYLRIYETTHNEVFYEERDAQIAELNTKYETREKESLIQLQNITIAEKNLQLKQSKIITFLFITILILLVGILIYRYLLHKKLKRVYTLLTEKNIKITNQSAEIENYSKQINESYLELKKLDQHKQAMTNMLAHDLKNPLNLLINIDAYKSESEKVRIVKQTSGQILNLILNLLDLNKAENNKLVLNRSETSLQEVLRQCFIDVMYLCEQRNITIKTIITKDFLINADKDLIIRVITNLLTNAIKFSPKNSNVIIESEELEKKQLRISIVDSGPGIEEKFKTAVFEKFYQVKRVRSGEINSSGLGLAFCKMAVESHNWKIGLDSKFGKGARFWILIDNYTVVGEEIKFEELNNKGLNNLTINISETEHLIIQPYLDQLLKTNVYAISSVMLVLLSIKNLGFDGLGNWLDSVKWSVETLNEIEFTNLINLLKDDN